MTTSTSKSAINENTQLEAQHTLLFLPQLSAITLLVGVLSTCWLLFASQSPSSPIHMGPLIGPIATLAWSCWVAGFGGLAISAFVIVFKMNSPALKKGIRLIAVGWAVLLSSLILGAFLGTNGVQLFKAYPRTLTVAFIKIVGFALLSVGLVIFSLDLWRGIRSGMPKHSANDTSSLKPF